MSSRSLRAYVSLVIVGLFLFSLTAWAASDDARFGPNRLRYNSQVSLYHQDDRGVPTFVAGELARGTNGDPMAIVVGFLEQNRGAFRIVDPASELRVRQLNVEENGAQHLRIDQYYRGLRVIGADLVAHVSVDGVLRGINGTMEPELELDVTSSLTPAGATLAAQSDLLGFFGAANPSDAELVVFPWEGQTYLAYRLFLLSDTPMGRWEYFVDAKTGAVIFKANRIMDTDAIGTGVGVMGTTRDHIDVDFTGSTYQMRNNTRQLTNNPHGHNGQMPAGNYLQTNIASSTLPGSIATDPDNNWNAGGSQAAAVDGQVYSALFYDWLLAALNRNGYTNTGATMLTVVNYSGEGNNNAYWDGSRIVVWSAGSGWRSLAGCPDVIAHEWGHAVTEYGGNMIYQKESGALNESFSDMMGAAFEFAHPTYDTPDWLMGENGQIGGTGFRDMANPHAKGDPDFYGTTDPYWIDVVNCTPSSFNDWCGVHTNSGVGNKWYYLLSDGGTHHSITVTGIGYENALKVAYRANMLYWTSSITYYNAALATVTAADDLDPSGAWATQVAKAWNAVGVTIPLASLEFAYPGGVPTMLTPNQPTNFSVLVTGKLGGVPLNNTGRLHYRIDAGSWVDIPMTLVGTNSYTATLPSVNCQSQVDFYVSAEETSNGVFTDPSPTSPFAAIGAVGSTTTFADNFEANLGWTTSSTATAGLWARGLPQGGGDRGDPASDYDGSGQCFLTDPNDGDTDIDGGTTNLLSPTFDLSAGDARISYARWYSNTFGAEPGADQMNIYISNNNGSSWTLVEQVGPTTQNDGGWIVNSFFVSDFVAPTAQVKMKFEASDLAGGSVVEAGIDDFKIVRFDCATNLLTITTNDLPDWTEGMAFSQQLEAINGSGQLTWIDFNGGLDGTGLTLSSTGLISGTPTVAGAISLIARVTDEAPAADVQNFDFVINPSLMITTTTLPEWTVNRPYSQQMLSTGGTGLKVWTDRDNNLVGTGLTVAVNGRVQGTPTATGTHAFTARVSDQIGANGDQGLSVKVNAAIDITTTSLPDATEGSAYSQNLLAVDGTGSRVWSDKNNNLAGSGLTLSTAGMISGTPTSALTINLTARVVDAAGSADEQPLTLVIKPPYICGDADGSQGTSIADAVYMINYIFSGGPAPVPLAAADCDCSGAVSIADAVYMIEFIFNGGPAPCANCP